MTAAGPSKPTISIRNVSHFYGAGALRKQALQSIDLDIWPGEIIVVTGPSGSGKTTMLTLTGALRTVQYGSLRVLGQELKGARYRKQILVRANIGYIFQAQNLLSSLTACQNVQMSLGPGGLISPRARKAALTMLDAVGLRHRAQYLPRHMSGGECQRVAIARALVRQPRIVLADEPTSVLDRKTGRAVVELLRQLARKQSCAILLVTHDNRILDVADRILELEDGKLSSFAGASSASAPDLLPVLMAQRSEKGQLDDWRALSAAAFHDLLGRLTVESQHFLNAIDMDGRHAAEPLFQSVLEAVLARARDVRGAGQAALFGIDLERRILHMRCTTENGGSIPQNQAPFDNRPAVRAAESRAPLLAPAGEGGLLCLPLFDSQNRVHGVVQFSPPKDGSFTGADGNALRDFTRPLGLILEVCQCLDDRHRVAKAPASGESA